MSAVVIEHVPVTQLPEDWRARLAGSAAATVTVRLEPEIEQADQQADFVTDDPAFGIWRDRTDVADVAATVRTLRASRFMPDGARKPS